MNEENKPIKKYFNFDDFLLTWGIRIILLVLLFYGIANFNENQIVIAILGSIIIFVLIFMRVDAKILILTNSSIIFRKIIFAFWKKDTVYSLKELEAVKVSGEYTVELDMARKAIPEYQSLGPNELVLTYKNGEIKKINVHFYKRRMIEFVDLANSLIN